MFYDTRLSTWAPNGLSTWPNTNIGFAIKPLRWGGRNRVLIDLEKMSAIWSKKYCYASWNGGEKKNSFEQEFTNWPNDMIMDRQLAWQIFSVQMMWLLISTRRPRKVQMEKQEPGFGSQYGKQEYQTRWKPFEWRTCKDICQLEMVCAICDKDEETINDVTWYYCLPTELWITTTKFFTPSHIYTNN